MILTSVGHRRSIGRILHVCGDDPCCFIRHLGQLLYSPRMWRWSYLIEVERKWNDVFSTYVEMILSVPDWTISSVRILHVCGDDPEIDEDIRVKKEYSPRMWRWSLSLNNLISVCRVFSTYVEMILVHHTGSFQNKGILHVCGDDPRLGVFLLWKIMYSPRMWRWSYIK